MPEALPISAGPTELRTAVGTVGNAIEMPIPAIRSATTMAEVLSLETFNAIHAKPTVCSASPTAITGRRPTRSDTAPAIGETSIGVASHGSRYTLVVSGE